MSWSRFDQLSDPALAKKQAGIRKQNAADLSSSIS